MNTIFQPPPIPPSNPFSEACAKLRAAGYTLAPADMPGLTIVSGPGMMGSELTMGQVIDLASRT
jgi:hypothetical protein